MNRYVQGTKTHRLLYKPGMDKLQGQSVSDFEACKGTRQNTYSKLVYRAETVMSCCPRRIGQYLQARSRPSTSTRTTRYCKPNGCNFWAERFKPPPLHLHFTRWTTRRRSQLPRPNPTLASVFTSTDSAITFGTPQGAGKSSLIILCPRSCTPNSSPNLHHRQRSYAKAPSCA